MPYRYILTLEVPDGDHPKLDAAYDLLDETDFIVREVGFPVDSWSRFSFVRWFNRRVADVRASFRQFVRGESDAMHAARLLKEDLRAVEPQKDADHADR